MSDKDARFMHLALAEARKAAARGEVPVGAVLVDADGHTLAADGNRTIENHDPSAHAEMLVIRAACASIGNERLPGATLYVTLEPCAMCAGAISFARIARLVWAADDPKMGAVRHGPRFFEQKTCHHRPELAGGEGADESAQMLKDFFRARRGGAGQS
ncbi:MAG TPA: nucleoside deaminase [Micropepsaceae bacterium]|nr:nucleoside deaminase [Micropepsaceae bacterium]